MGGRVIGKIVIMAQASIAPSPVAVIIIHTSTSVVLFALLNCFDKCTVCMYCVINTTTIFVGFLDESNVFVYKLHCQIEKATASLGDKK